MLTSYNWIKDYIKGKLPNANKLANLFAMHAFEVEEIRESKDDWLLDIDVLPNRAHDCLSHIGIARECAAITNLEFKPPIVKIKEERKIKTSDLLEIDVREEICTRYTARIIKGIKVGPTTGKIKERLESLGLQSINNVVDILNYVMLETGQPLHAFDFDKLEGKKKKKIIVRKAKRGEQINALDDNQYKLANDILIIADSKDPLAIAGIKGGKKASITKETKNIIIESANFDMLAIRRTRQKLALQTDASLRFEHEPDPNLTLSAINRATQMVNDICGGKITKEIIDVHSREVLPEEIKLSLDKVKKVLGLEITKKEVIQILKRLELEILESKQNNLLVEIPTFRRDLHIPEDLIEEIGRIYGFGKIPAKVPSILAVLPEKNIEVFWEEKCKNILKEAGFSEIYGYSFVSDKDIKNYHFNQKNLIEVKNPISIEQKYLRPSLIPGLLRNSKENLKNFSNIKIFELGKIYRDLKIAEKRSISGVLIRPESNSKNFFRLKGVMDLLFEKLGISNIWYDEFEATPEDSELSIWKPGARAEIKSGNIEIGFLGEIHSKVLDKLNIPNEVIVFDIDFERLQRICSEEHEYQPISKFPEAVRDLAILIPTNVKVAEVLNIIDCAGGNLVRDVDLFDVYEGSGISEQKKNLAFHIIYQAKDRTLNKEEINNLHQKIINKLEENPSWEVRK